MSQACTLFLAKNRRIQERCLDIACNNNMQDLINSDSGCALIHFNYLMAIYVWLLEVISVNYHHYLNMFEPVVSSFYVVGCNHRLVFPSVTRPELHSD